MNARSTLESRFPHYVQNPCHWNQLNRHSEMCSSILLALDLLLPLIGLFAGPAVFVIAFFHVTIALKYVFKY